MKLRKGDKALIKRTGQVVTILKIELIRKNGKVHKYCKLQPKDGKPEHWMEANFATSLKQSRQHSQVTGLVTLY